MVDLIEEVYATVATYKTKQALAKIHEVSKNLKPNSQILVLGPGQGAETIIFKKGCPTSELTVVDTWNDNGWVDNDYLSCWAENTEANFRENCKKFNVDLKEIHCCDIFGTKKIFEFHDSWDLIYYDCKDNKSGKEFDIIAKMLNVLWKKISVGGILIGDDYAFNNPDFKMTPVVDDFVINITEPFEFDSDKRNTSFHWMVKKNG